MPQQAERGSQSVDVLVSTPHRTRRRRQTLTQHAPLRLPLTFPRLPSAARPRGKAGGPLAGTQGESRPGTLQTCTAERGEERWEHMERRAPALLTRPAAWALCRCSGPGPADLRAQLLCQGPRGFLGTRWREWHSCPGPSDFAFKKITLIVLPFRLKAFSSSASPKSPGPNLSCAAWGPAG